jgi:hypothetical protein
MKNLIFVTTAMSKELRAFVQILLADEYKIAQSDNARASEIMPVTGFEVSGESPLWPSRTGIPLA